MKDSLLLARSLYRAIKELEEAHAKRDAFRGSDQATEAAWKADDEVESAEDALASVLLDLKQWTIEP